MSAKTCALLLGATFALAVTACQGRNEPHFFRAEGGPKLHLPEPMRRALRTYDPGFRVYEKRDFAPDVLRERERWDSSTAIDEPFAVLADFDGNGYRDAALLGSSDRGGRVLVVLADSGSARVVEIEHGRFDPGERDHLQVLLSHQLPGPVRSEFEEAEPRVDLAHDGFYVVYFGKGSQLQFWKDGRFVSYTTGD